MMEGWFAK